MLHLHGGMAGAWGDKRGINKQGKTNVASFLALRVCHLQYKIHTDAQIARPRNKAILLDLQAMKNWLPTSTSIVMWL